MTPMPSPVPTTKLPDTNLRADDLREMIAGIPGLLGFQPAESLVLITLTYTDRLCIGATLRCDLPAPGRPDPTIHRLCTTAANNGAVAAVAVVIGGEAASPPEHLPHQDLMDLVDDLLHEEDVTLLHAAWVPAVAEGETWWCYGEERCTGRVPDPGSSILAAASAASGVVTYPSRADLASQLEFDPPEELDRRAELLNVHLKNADPPTLSDELRLVHEAVDAAATTRELPFLTDEQVVALAAALSNPDVRDDCLAVALSDQADAAERLWTVLVRATPAPERAEPAFLLGIAAYLRGEGVLAGMAMTIALESNPGHQLAELLSTVLMNGLPPARLREILMSAFTKAAATRAAEPPWRVPPQ